MTKIYKGVAKLLIITLLTTMMPINIIKASAEEATESVTPETQGDTEIIRELEEKRNENTKYFLKNDGTYEAVLYEDPVHYLKDGKWADIDNSLEDKGNHYESKKMTLS